MSTTVVPIFDPICTTKESVEKNLQNFAKNDSYKNSVQYVHPFDGTLLCTMERGKIEWKILHSPVELSSLLNQQSDLASVEDNIKTIIENCYSKDLRLSFEKSNITIQPLPEGQETIQCSVGSSASAPPPLFVVSKVINNRYFDLVVFPVFTDVRQIHPDQVPLCYSFTTLSPNFSFQHSGDQHNGENLLQNIKLTNPSLNATGIVTAHAYNNRSFFEIKDSDPNICLVDYREDDNSINIYVIHFPLSKDFVRGSSVGHICKFDYNANDGKITWTIPQQPEFDNNKFLVGSKYSEYKNGIVRFSNTLEERKTRKRGRVDEKIILLPGRTIERRTVIDDEDDEDDNSRTLIIQKPLLKSDSGKRILNDFLIHEKFKIYTFHRNIGSVDEDADDDDDDDNNFNYTLPIAGGSILSEKSSVKLGKPIKRQSVANKFRKSLNKTNNGRPIVIVSNKSSSADMPKIHSKLNAIYVLVDFDRVKPTADRLNNINAILPVAMQGPLSTVFVYSEADRGNFYYYRGVIYNKDIEFGQSMNIKEILLEAQRSVPPPLVMEAAAVSLSPFWPIFNRSGRKIFDVYKTKQQQNEDASVIARTTIENVQRHLNRDEPLQSQLKFIIAQMEVNLSSDEFQNIINIVTRMAYESTQMSRKNCLELLCQNFSTATPIGSEIRKVLSNKNYNYAGVYSKRWILNFIGEILNAQNKFELVQHHSNTLKSVFKIMKNHLNTLGDYTKTLLEVFNTSVSMRSSHGIRKRGLRQIIRKQDIDRNVAIAQNLDNDGMDDFFSEHCTEDGVILLAVNKKEMLRWLTASSFLQSSWNDHILSLMTRHTNFDRLHASLASPFLSQQSFSFEYNDREDMLIFPILKELKDAMENPHQYNWRNVENGGPIDLTRILLRKSIYDILTKVVRENNLRLTENVDSPASPVVGKILINVLFAAIYAMTGGRRDFSATDKNDAWITQFRCLTGLILSVMASGSDRPFNLAFLAVLYKNNQSTLKFDMTKPLENNLWLRELINVWKFLKLENVVDARANAVSTITVRAIDLCHTLIISDRDSEKRDKRQELQQQLERKADYSFNELCPFVELILGFEFPKILKNDYRREMTSSSSGSGTIDISKAEEEMIAEKVEKILKLRNKVTHRKFNNDTISIPIAVEENLAYILGEYEKLKELENRLEDSGHLKNSRFFKLVGHLKKAFDQNQNVDRYLNHVYLIAKEIYLNESLFLYESLAKLREYLFGTSEARSKNRMDDINLGQEILPFSVEVANKFKNNILQKLLNFVDSTQPYWKIHTVFITLMKCKTENDYKSKEFKESLNDYVKMKRRYGHFMSGFLSPSISVVDVETRKRQRHRDMLTHAMERNENLKSMMSFLMDIDKSSNQLIVENALLTIERPK